MDAEPESYPSSASCRIVVVSSSLDTSRQAAYRIKALSGDTSEDQTSSEVIHWTIKNKYYTAPVHFHPIHIEGLESIELDDVPAVIYAWKDDDPYKEHMKEIAEQTSSNNPEVSLAISMTPTTEEELEDFFFEHGFEYIQGHSEVQDRSAVLSESDTSSAPGMYRAVDALSTIMWPSMVRTESTKPTFGTEPGTGGEDNETDVDFETLKRAAGRDGQPGIEREMELLEKWLEEDEREYSPLHSHGQAQSQPMETNTEGWPRAREGAGDGDGATGPDGFEDDFAGFVTAPLNRASESDLPSTADIRSASARIFGPPHPSSSDTSDPAYPTVDDDHSDIDSSAFDLTRIFDRLQEMKEEIGRIPDEGERRHAAAKAALGLVYGLEEREEVANTSQSH